MNIVSLAFKAVFPLLCFMLLGYFLKFKKILTKDSAEGINSLVFRIILPLSVAESIYSAGTDSLFSVKTVALVVFSSLIMYVVLFNLVWPREPDNSIKPVMVQGMHKANYTLLSIPIAASFYGDDIGMTAILIMFITPVVNICSTHCFEKAIGGSTDFLCLLKKVLMNPLVLSSIIGILLKLSGLVVSELIMSKVVTKISSMATPLAMITLGFSFDFSRLGHFKKKLSLVCIVKLLVMPVLILSVAVLIGIRNANLIAVLIFSGGPAAVNSYSTAVAMGGNGELAGQIVVVSSALSIFSLFMWLCILGGMGFIA